MDKENWMSMNEVCDHLHISRDTAKKWVREKNMPGYQIDRTWRFSQEEVDEWVRKTGRCNGEQGDR